MLEETTTANGGAPEKELPKGPRRFSLKRREIVVELENEQGLYQPYTLKELTGAERNAWFAMSNNRMAKGTMQGEGRDVKSFDNMCADLLGLTLYNPEGKLLTVREINNFPSETQMELFKMSLELSALDKKGNEEAKNSSAANTQPG